MSCSQLISKLSKYSTCINFIDRIECILENYTLYEKDEYGTNKPKNIKLETRAILNESNKINIHHYRCHIHIIADRDCSNTVNGTNLEISMTLSHRFRATKNNNNHSHIYLGLSYCDQTKQIVFDGYRKTGTKTIKILNNTNPDELCDFLLYENITKMINGNFEYVDSPVGEKKLFTQAVGDVNLFGISNRKSFFIMRDIMFWSKLIKFSVNQLFVLLTKIFEYKSQRTSDPHDIVSLLSTKSEHCISKKELTNIINNMKKSHFPADIPSITNLNCGQVYSKTRDDVLRFSDNFSVLIEKVVDIFNRYFSSNQLLTFLTQQNKHNDLSTVELLNTENKYNNLFKIFLKRICEKYVTITEDGMSVKKQTYHYYEIVKNTISSIQDIKAKLIDGDNVFINQIIYDGLIFIKDRIFFCNYLTDEINSFESFIGRLST